MMPGYPFAEGRDPQLNSTSRQLNRTGSAACTRPEARADGESRRSAELGCPHERLAVVTPRKSGPPLRRTPSWGPSTATRWWHRSRDEISRPEAGPVVGWSATAGRGAGLLAASGHFLDGQLPVVPGNDRRVHGGPAGLGERRPPAHAHPRLPDAIPVWFNSPLPGRPRGIG